MYNDYNYSVEEHVMQGTVANFLYRVYGWMAAALVISAGVAYYVATVPAIYMAILTKPILLLLLFVAQFALVMALSFLLPRISYGTAVFLFMIYAASLGMTLSTIFIVYTTASIALTFMVTAGMFGTMCIYGYLTKADLGSWRSLGTMALIGLIIGFIINLFLQSQMFDYILSGIGVIIFTALTAADMQKIKQLGYQLLSHEQMMAKASVLGALTLYLDFVNLFLLLLRFTGRSRD